MTEYDRDNWYVGTSEEGGLHAQPLEGIAGEPVRYRGDVSEKKPRNEGGFWWHTVWRDPKNYPTRYQARKAALAKQRELAAAKAA